MSVKDWRRWFVQLTRPPRRAWRHLTGGGWKSQLATWTLLLMALAGGAVLYAWSGLILIGSSSGHWAVTRWYLHFSMRSAVRTHALGIKAPPLDDPAMVLKGAGHYATGCAPCHGSPEAPRSLIARNMVPESPFLPPKIREWKPAELFWIVKHGIKFTAMPAWPSQQRDDEVWSMVAFLRELPDMTPARYRRLAYGGRGGGDAAAQATTDHLRRLSDPPGRVLDDCARCHGEGGAGRRTGAIPKLAGQSEQYLLASLSAFASGDRHSGIMQPVAAGLSEPLLRKLARYYARQQPRAGPPESAGDVDFTAIKRGEIIAGKGLPRQGIPSCVHCHGPREGARNPYYPELAGQYADYLGLQLSLFHSGRRGGTPYAHIMHTAVKHLDQGQIRALALYYASLGQDSKEIP